MITRIVSLLSLLLLAFAAAPVGAQAPQDIVIGVLYPLSGPVAQVGIDSVNAVKLAAEIINNRGSPLAPPIGKTPGLSEAKTRLVIVDRQGKPDVGQAGTERLITQKKVHPLFGAYVSSVTATACQVAERYGVPYVT